MPTSDRTAATTPAPAPAIDPASDRDLGLSVDVIRPAVPAATADHAQARLERAVERVAERSDGEGHDASRAAIVVAAVAGQARAAVLGLGQGGRDGLAAVGEGLSGVAGMLGCDPAARAGVALAIERAAWDDRFASDTRGALAGRAVAYAASAGIQASPGIASASLGPLGATLGEAMVPAGVAASEARSHGADASAARHAGLEAGAAAAVLGHAPAKAMPAWVDALIATDAGHDLAQAGSRAVAHLPEADRAAARAAAGRIADGLGHEVAGEPDAPARDSRERHR